MTINFLAPGEIPQPKDKVKIEYFAADVYPDRWRIKVELRLTPFMMRPNVAIALLQTGDSPNVVADMTIIETMHNNMEFTMHIRGVDDPQGHYTLKARLYYEEGVMHPTDAAELPLDVPAAEDMPNAAPPELE
jgi:hypothetical protein